MPPRGRREELPATRPSGRPCYSKPSPRGPQRPPGTPGNARERTPSPRVAAPDCAGIACETASRCRATITHTVTGACLHPMRVRDTAPHDTPGTRTTRGPRSRREALETGPRWPSMVGVRALARAGSDGPRLRDGATARAGVPRVRALSRRRDEVRGDHARGLALSQRARVREVQVQDARRRIDGTEDTGGKISSTRRTGQRARGPRASSLTEVSSRRWQGRGERWQGWQGRELRQRPWGCGGFWGVASCYARPVTAASVHAPAIGKSTTSPRTAGRGE